ncbi:m protein repeat protein [Grosmannia clavigera kw1407]|uniref:M protein repeat protein n=1 Tax=Grosmannia clavigera (strain kw1407 / UAMH 11150) TaxID=655863 RepID=F0XMI2_GROCL|nr:m protein repeat protein [Grosmannia clavigera kw1407]EFX01153.1 m protein repeat protein [Grosmannia clavigera kw1407]
MASGGKGTRWGSLLSQAVAGVEARLDTMLAEADEMSKQPKSPGAPQSPAKQSSTSVRSGSSSRVNERLQERLARAVAAKNAGSSRGQSPAPSSTAANSPRQSVDIASRTSLDGARPVSKDKEPVETTRLSTDSARSPPSTMDTQNESNGDGTEASGATEITQTDTAALAPAAELEIATSTTSPVPAEGTLEPGSITDEDSAQLAKTLQEALLKEQQEHQEETHQFTEKIDALQAKLQYMSREAAEAAKKAGQAATPGSLEKKVAEKDQQIAALMEEGKNLGVTEQKHRALLKKLRTKMAEDEKAAGELRAARTKAEAELQTLRPKARRVTELEKMQEDGRRQLAQAQTDLAEARAGLTAREGTVAALRLQLEEAIERADKAAAKVQDEALEAARKQIKELEEQVATLRLEKSLTADRAKAQVEEWREKAERAEERARIAEVEAMAEVQVMEGKLEATRARAEEASSGAQGDSQAKLLRQVETLQSQYAIASENWQGIEATLLSRVSGLETERDEAQQRESEMRKKAREAALRAKRLEEELEDVQSKLPRAEEAVGAHETRIAALNRRAEEAEAALQQARAELDSQRVQARKRQEQQLEQELEQEQEQEQEREREREQGRGRGPTDLRRTWLDDLPGRSSSNSRPESPLVQGGGGVTPGMPTRTWSSDFLGLQGLPNKLRKTSTPSSHGDAAERFSLRRPSGQPPLSSVMSVMSVMSPMAMSPTAIGPEDAVDEPDRSASPQLHMMGGSGGGGGGGSGGTPQQTDLVSVSTVAAGPSVQLVERMSAAIRRLESEKVAAREELARISSQRNEARAEVLALLKDAEAGRAAADRVATLEKDVSAMQERYETTLELLGEKSELVEELQADVQDVKAMYRDLVERSIKGQQRQELKQAGTDSNGAGSGRRQGGAETPQCIL